MKGIEQDLKYYTKLNYDVVIRKRGDVFVLHLPELLFIEEDESLENAYKKIELKKEKYFQEMIESGYQDLIKVPKPEKVAPSIHENFYVKRISLFLIQLFVILLLFGILFQFVSIELEKQRVKFEKNLSSIKGIGHISHLIVDKLDTMSEEKKEELRLRLRKIILHTKPFLDEFKILFEETVDPQIEKKQIELPGN